MEKERDVNTVECQILSGIPVAGAVAAGYPSPAEEEFRDIISIDEYLITRPS